MQESIKKLADYVMEDIEEVILNSQLSYLKNIRGGIFQLNKNEISKEDMHIIDCMPQAGWSGEHPDFAIPKVNADKLLCD